MYNYKLTIGYDGARYSGWQKNKNAKDTVQSKIEAAVKEAVGEEVNLVGSGRTDKGVHAEMQIANFHCKDRQKSSSLKYQLNSFLPEDIVILAVNKMDESFHSRFSAKSKTYRYTIWKANCERHLLKSDASKYIHNLPNVYQS